MPDLYIRPIGFCWVANRDRIDEVRGALPLAGNRHLDFTGVEVIERRGGTLTLKTAGLGELSEVEWGRRTVDISGFFNAILMPRPRIAGLAMDRAHIMGIVNVTPDSFSDGGRLTSTQAAIEHARALEVAGAGILDIGGESTRPGSDPVPLDEELRRVMPVIEGLAGRVEARISIDTRKAEVMRRAAAAGADLINDISALTHDRASLDVAAESGLPVILMHALGDPKTMQDAPAYDHVLLDVFDYLEQRIAACEAAGIERGRLIADPGIGFGKTVDHNLTLLHGLSLFHGLGVPILLGASRKRFIGAVTGAGNVGGASADQRPDERVAGSIAAALMGVAQGAQIIRVHDVAETKQALALWQAIERSKLAA